MIWPIHVVLEDAHQVTTASETDAEVSIGTEIPDLDATDDIQTRDIIFSYEECNPEDPSTSCFDLHGNALLNIHFLYFLSCICCLEGH